MGWFEDALNTTVKAYGNTWKNVFSAGGLVNNDVSRFFENEVVNKSDLRAAQTGSFLSGLPYVGEFIRGINGVQQLEDLYDKTGKVPAYYGSTGNGASGLAQGLTDLTKNFTRKIEDGTNSLHEFYSGDKEQFPEMHVNDRLSVNDWSDARRMYRTLSNNMHWNQR